jgi:starvation-inducible DNA-binding protein
LCQSRTRPAGSAGAQTPAARRLKLLLGSIDPASGKVEPVAENLGTNDLVVSDVIRTNELQVWFLAEHLVETPITSS